MNFSSFIPSIDNTNIFLDSPLSNEYSTQFDIFFHFPSQDSPPNTLDYISQFINLSSTPKQKTSLFSTQEQPNDNKYINNNTDYPPIYHESKVKKINKSINSPYHNYQKHLSYALKNLIILPHTNNQEQIYKIVGGEIWNKYMELDIKTKNILYCVFNEQQRNDFGLKDLKKYGFYQILRKYGLELFNKGKKYLRDLVIEGIDQEKIDEYLKTRKLKRVQGLKKYILQFREEIKEGQLKKRHPTPISTLHQ